MFYIVFLIKMTIPCHGLPARGHIRKKSIASSCCSQFDELYLSLTDVNNQIESLKFGFNGRNLGYLYNGKIKNRGDLARICLLVIQVFFNAFR